MKLAWRGNALGKVIIQDLTTKNPITTIGYEAGICWGSDVSDEKKNYKRGFGCLEANHGRTLEFPQVYLTLDGYSARVIREWYTHIGGAPTRLQASTRYVDYEHGFDYVTPYSIENRPEAKAAYDKCMNNIKAALKKLDGLGIQKEDSAMLLPLGMTTKVVTRTNLRALIDMAHQRTCSRAYWEFRTMFHEICAALGDYSDEWECIVENYMVPKCDVLGYCPEKKSCGWKPKRR